MTGVSSQVEILPITVNGILTDVDAIQDFVDNLPDPADYTTELAELPTGLADAQTTFASHDFFALSQLTFKVNPYRFAMKYD